jgi:hypothetical protein
VKAWVRIADAYRHFSDRVPSADGRHDLFRLLLACSNNARDHALEAVRRTALPRALAEEAIDHMSRPLSGAEGVAMLNRLMGGAPE